MKQNIDYINKSIKAITLNTNEFSKNFKSLEKNCKKFLYKKSHNSENNNNSEPNNMNNDKIGNKSNINRSFFEDNDLKKELVTIKNEIFEDIKKINLKILTEFKSQAEDIRTLYQEFHNIDNYIISKKIISNQTHTATNSNLTNTESKNINIKPDDAQKDTQNILNSDDKESNEHNQENIIKNFSTMSNYASLLEKELSKKANLDQLNFAIETQTKINEVFSSASRISRFCWNSEGTLLNNKYIQWSIQNINTALDVFMWEKNSEKINILQNGIYKIVLGIIGLENGKKFGIVLNEDKNLITDSPKEKNIVGSSCNNEKQNYNNKYDFSYDKVNYIEKYIACLENTQIKIIIFNSDEYTDNFEEAFLEITKII